MLQASFSLAKDAKNETEEDKRIFPDKVTLEVATKKMGLISADEEALLEKSEGAIKKRQVPRSANEEDADDEDADDEEADEEEMRREGGGRPRPKATPKSKPEFQIPSFLPGGGGRPSPKTPPKSKPEFPIPSFLPGGDRGSDDQVCAED